MAGIGAPEREEILLKLAAVDSGDIQFELLREPSRPEALKGASQALFFLKPELLYPELDREPVLVAVDRVLAGAGIEVGGIAVLGPARLADTIAAHYGVINRVSRLGLAALSEAARAKLDEQFGAEIAAGKPVLGGHEVVDRYGVQPAELEGKLGTPTKLAPGTYAAPATLDGQELIVLNGFHPAQLDHFAEPAARVVALEVFWSDRTWASFRTDVVGATKPENAVAGSVRAMLLAAQSELGLGPVGVSANGVHGSAGPIEAMVEISRFLGVPLEDTAVGAAALAASVPLATLQSIASSDEDGGARQRLFDATEEVEPATAIDHLARH